jgi:hypothetical protein
MQPFKRRSGALMAETGNDQLIVIDRFGLGLDTCWNDRQMHDGGQSGRVVL